MFKAIKESVLKSRILLVLPLALSALVLTAGTASASLGPVLYNSHKVVFFVPNNSKATWQLSLWHKGTLEGRDIGNGTGGQELKVRFPQGVDCDFQVDVKDLSAKNQPIVYSGHLDKNCCDPSMDLTSAPDLGN